MAHYWPTLVMRVMRVTYNRSYAVKLVTWLEAQREVSFLTMSLITLRPSCFNPYGLVWRSDPALRFHQKYLNSCSEEEQRSHGVETTSGWGNTDRIFNFGWTIPL